MSNTKNDQKQIIPKFVWFVLFASIIFIIIRLPAGLLANKGIILCIDELGMSLSVIDRFLGIPSTSLAWPGATLQLFSIPFILLDFIFAFTSNISQDNFVLYISNIYREPWHTITLIRYIVIIVSSTGLAMMYIPLYHFTKNPLISFIGLVIIATQPTIWLYSHMAVGDALSFGLACR